MTRIMSRRMGHSYHMQAGLAVYVEYVVLGPLLVASKSRTNNNLNTDVHVRVCSSQGDRGVHSTVP